MCHPYCCIISHASYSCYYFKMFRARTFHEPLYSGGPYLALMRASNSFYPLSLLPQDSPHRPEKQGRREDKGRGPAALTDAGRKGAFLPLLEHGREPGREVVERRILIKPCSACGFHLKDQQHKPGVSANISLNYLLI